MALAQVVAEKRSEILSNFRSLNRSAFLPMGCKGSKAQVEAVATKPFFSNMCVCVLVTYVSQKSLPPDLGRFKDGWVDFAHFFQTFLKIGQAPTKDSKAEVQVGGVKNVDRSNMGRQSDMYYVVISYIYI